jgi:hypothetical protein
MDNVKVFQVARGTRASIWERNQLGLLNHERL